MKQELKPCPFCDCKDIEVKSEGSIYVECSRCFVTGRYYATEEKAINAWNTRPDNSGESAEMVKCETLTTEISESQMRYEIAKNFATQTLAIMMNDPSITNLSSSAMAITIQGTCKGAVNIANELINQLKQQSDEK